MTMRPRGRSYTGSMATRAYDAVLLVSFGGPERREDVLPFLKNVVRGRNVPEDRLRAVAEQYYAFGGRSPINDANRLLLGDLMSELMLRGVLLPMYWGNRNWHPLLPDVVRKMADDGVRRALALVTSAFSSYSSCRQYRENIEDARSQVGPEAPVIDTVRPFFNHPGFIEAMEHRVGVALSDLDAEGEAPAVVVFTAHSLPLAMSESCDYVAQLEEACRLVSERVGVRDWELAFQSRSGPPSQPWLEPDVCDHLRALRRRGVKRVCIAPIGFVSNHIEILYDLDTRAAAVAREIGLDFVRADTVGRHPYFIDGMSDLILERLQGRTERAAVGRMPPRPDVCPADCCPPPRRPVNPT